MPRILIVDANPDHQRALGGLIRYRTESTTTIVDTCVEAARTAVRERPDVILVNVLLYVDGQFAFRRALGRNTATRQIPILVHCSGQMEPLTRRRVEASGAAGVLELPVSAEELVYYVEEAVRAGAREAGPREGVHTVRWPLASTEEAGAAERAPDGRQVRPVDWGAVRSSSSPPEEGPAERPPAAGERSAPPRPAGEPASGAVRGNGRREGFRASTFRSVDPSEVKGGGKQAFQETDWPKVDPDEVKRRRPRR